MMLLRYYFIFFICLLATSSTQAQNYSVNLISVDGKNELLNERIKLPEKFSDAAEAYKYITELIPKLQSQGFLAASVDSFSIENNVYHAFVYLGETYKWAKLDMSELPENLLSQNGYSKIQFEGRKLEPKLISRISEKMLQWAEQN